MGLNHEEIRRYLLGNLAAAGQENIDLRIIEDEDFATEARAVEDQLIESYIDGELNEEDVANFRSNYLVSEARANRVKELAALRTAVARYTVAPVEPAPERTEDEVLTLSGLFRRFATIPAFAGLAIVAVIGVVAWLYLFGDRPTDLETEYAALNRSDLSDVKKLGQYTAVELLPGTFRSDDKAVRVRTENLSDVVLLRLPLGFEPSPDSKYQVVVIRDGKGIFDIDDEVPEREGSTVEVRVLLPGSIFVSGQYQIRLTRGETKEAPVVYNFTVE